VGVLGTSRFWGSQQDVGDPLGGKTPKAAVRTKKGRQAVIV
jgi:hypothetical protein